MALFIPIVVTALLVCITGLIYRYLKVRHQLRGFHQPRSYPFLGHMAIIKPDPEGFLDQIMGMSMLYPQKPKAVVFWIGILPVVMIYEPELAEQVFCKVPHMNKGFLYDLLKPWLGNGLLTSKYEEWKPRRKLLTPTFHYDILRNFVHVFNSQSHILVDKLNKIIAEDNVIDDIYKPVSLCALDIICETSMGQSVNAQEKESDYLRAVLRINDIIQNRQKNPLLYPDFIFKNLPVGKEHKWALDVLHNFTKKVIDERRKEYHAEFTMKNEKLAFLDLLLEMENRGEIDEKSIQEEVDTFMFEGHDTTATGITWALHLVGCYPDVQQKLLDEIKQVIGDSVDITIDHLSNLKYMECFIKEVLRLYPSVPIIARKLGEDLVLGDKVIPKGVEVLLNLYLIHRDEDNWEDPEAFNPERFVVASTRNAFSYVPFSAGSRNCIGQRFAMMEEKVVLAQIIRAFEIRSMRRRDTQRSLTELILRPTDGIKVQLLKRQY